MPLKWFSPPTSDDSSNDDEEISQPGAVVKKTLYRKNIYSKTLKKRQYNRRRDDKYKGEFSNLSIKPLRCFPSHQQTDLQKKSVAIAKQIVEKAKGDKRLQLAKNVAPVENNHSPVSRFGRLVKKKLLDYDDFTGGHNKRKQFVNSDISVSKIFKGEDGERHQVQPGVFFLTFKI